MLNKIIPAVMDWMFVSPTSPNSSDEVFTHNVMVFGGGAFERLLGLEEVMKTGPSQWD